MAPGVLVTDAGLEPQPPSVQLSKPSLFMPAELKYVQKTVEPLTVRAETPVVAGASTTG